MSEIRQIQVDGVNYDLVISEDEVSATSAAESAAEALSYKNQAATSATNAATSAANAANSAEEAIISARSAESAAYIAGGVSSITDPNEDGNLVVVPPNISDSGWAVRYDVDQTVLLSAGEQAQARANIGLGGWLYLNADTDRTDVNARKAAIATLYADVKATGIPVGAIRYSGGYYLSYIFTGRPHQYSSSEVIYVYEQTWGSSYAVNIWQLNNGSWSLVRTI